MDYSSSCHFQNLTACLFLPDMKCTISYIDECLRDVIVVYVYVYKMCSKSLNVECVYIIQRVINMLQWIFINTLSIIAFITYGRN